MVLIIRSAPRSRALPAKISVRRQGPGGRAVASKRPLTPGVVRPNRLRLGRDQRRLDLVAVALAQGGAQVADAVDEPEFHALRAAQYSPENRSSSAPFSLPPRRDFTSSMKLAWISSWIALSRATCSGFSGRNGSSIALLIARGVDAPLDADLVDQLGESERRADHADRADDRGRIGEDLVGRARDHVAARGRDILDEGDDRHFLLGRELADALEDQVRLHRRASRRIDQQRDRACARPRKGALQRLCHRGKRQARAAAAWKSR